jgi:hypothetical protein
MSEPLRRAPNESDADEVTRVRPIRECDAVRSTMIIASLQALRRRGRFDGYVSAIDPRARDAVLALASPAWVPVTLAEAHYAACDALQMPVAEMIAIGIEVARVDAAGAHVLIGLARTGGVDVWSLLDRLPANWRRMYRGSSFRTIKLGPKDARILIEGNSLTRFEYWRTGLRGVGEGLFRHFCSRLYIKEERDAGEGGCASYLVSWA